MTLYDVGMHDVSITRTESKPTDHTSLEHLPTSVSVNHLSKVSRPVSVLKIDLLYFGDLFQVPTKMDGKKCRILGIKGTKLAQASISSARHLETKL